MGHYRRVNPHVWNMWAGTYRGSGPAIWVVSFLGGGKGGQKNVARFIIMLPGLVWSWLVDALVSFVLWMLLLSDVVPSSEMFEVRHVHEHEDRR